MAEQLAKLGVYDYYHFHSTTHEATGMRTRMRITLQMAADGGTIVKLTAGDILVLPAGTSHIRLENSSDSRWSVATPKAAIGI